MAVDENKTLYCRKDNFGMLDVAYIWTHNGIHIKEKGNFNNPRLIPNDATLDIINATLNEAGIYKCTIKSAVSEMSSVSVVIVDGPPGTPGGVQVVNIIGTSARLRWTDGASYGRDVLMYTISVRTNWNQTWFNIAESTSNYSYKNLSFYNYCTTFHHHRTFYDLYV